ncbi:MAG: YqiA/YcfP family alpha/beta fold hydrolase [Coleofasciculus sp. B1-GNL1-01]
MKRPLPTLILHGQHDDVIPINESLIYAKERSWVQIIPLNSDHSLSGVKAEIWQSIRDFCQ